MHTQFRKLLARQETRDIFRSFFGRTQAANVQAESIVHEFQVARRYVARRDLEQRVILEMPRPCVITSADLIDSAESYLTPLAGNVSPEGKGFAAAKAAHDAAFESEYEGFVTIVCGTANKHRWSRPFRVATGLFELSDVPNPIWIGESGFRLVFVGILSTEPEAEDAGITAPRDLYARIEASASRRAIRRCRKEITNILRTAIETLLLIKRLEQNYGDGFHVDFMRTGNELLAIPMETWSIPLLLDAYYCKSTKKDSMYRRIRNAIHLLVQSDQQSHESIGLSLSVSALEALMAESGSEISTQMAENIITLLEPESRLRADGVAFVKNLYAARSRTLHGGRLEHGESLRIKARLLAGAVLLAVLERREFQRKCGNSSESPSELLGELKRSKYVGGEVPGVSPSVVRRFWSGEGEFGS